MEQLGSISTGIRQMSDDVFARTSTRDFGAMTRTHQAKLYRTACFLTGNTHEGEDLLQETLLEAWKGWESFEGRSSAYTWLYRILIHRYHRWQRRQIVRRMFFVRAEECDWENLQTFVDPSSPPGSLMEREEQNAQLWKFLESLRPKHREALVLRYVENMRLEQIAETLGLPLGTVKSRLNHAHRLLGDRLRASGISRSQI